MAMVGGFASVISGGKFLNGAVSAAFVHLFNAEAGGGRRASRHYLKKLTAKQLAKLGDFATRLRHMNVKEFNKYFGTHYADDDFAYLGAKDHIGRELLSIAHGNFHALAVDGAKAAWSYDKRDITAYVVKVWLSSGNIGIDFEPGTYHIRGIYEIK